HGLRAGAFWIFHRAAFWHGVAGNALETRDASCRILGLARGNAMVGGNVYDDEVRSQLGARVRAFSAGPGSRARHVPGAVVLRDVCGGHCACDFGDQAETGSRAERIGLRAHGSAARGARELAAQAGSLGSCSACGSGRFANHFLVRRHERRSSHYSDLVFRWFLAAGVWIPDFGERVGGMVASAQYGFGGVARPGVVGRAAGGTWPDLLLEVLPKRGKLSGFVVI